MKPPAQVLVAKLGTTADMVVITLCRFDHQQNLNPEDVDILKTPYVAISHIWGSTSWHMIPGIWAKVVLSKQKVWFILNKLPTLVGERLFWMDILAVDQNSEEARLQVVQHIPDVYRNAEKTIVVREDGGFKGCCFGILDLVYKGSRGFGVISFHSGPCSMNC